MEYMSNSGTAPAITVTTADYHTAGEPFRIVTGGMPDIPGNTVLERREYAINNDEIDSFRQLLVNEPRGHADMYGGFIVPPDDSGAHFGVLFWHKDGFSTACGHGTIALGAWAVSAGRVAVAEDGDTDVVIDVPSGRVTARVSCRGGKIEHVSFGNVPAYVLGRGIPVETSRGKVLADLSYGGAIYASVRADSVGLSVKPENYADLLALGREVKWALQATEWARHPSERRLDGIYGTILYDDLGMTPDGPHQRNVAVFADGQVDRSPCGSGTSARVALLADDGTLKSGQVLVNESIVSTRYLARVVENVTAEGRDAVISEVRSMAYRTGEHTFVLDAEDPVGTGFVLR
jgi:proline racemase